MYMHTNRLYVDTHTHTNVHTDTHRQNNSYVCPRCSVRSVLN